MGSGQACSVLCPLSQPIFLAPMLRMQRCVDSACTSLESLAVLHWARALPLLLVAIAELRKVVLTEAAAATDFRGRSATGHGVDPDAVGALGISPRSLDVMSDAVQHMLGLVQVWGVTAFCLLLATLPVASSVPAAPSFLRYSRALDLLCRLGLAPSDRQAASGAAHRSYWREYS